MSFAIVQDSLISTTNIYAYLFTQPILRRSLSVDVPRHRLNLHENLPPENPSSFGEKNPIRFAVYQNSETQPH
ncbi:hypothetical protein Cylst_3885 [Cylindrospermum stagnale PCC 7417]|uniref:Uncharacterized protein n=1 Tax=Cylindrospermum stagnale PCC 7417 TaxID=56107 RepID=K9X0J3_9NOST|nr:hypothetical protein Cylst_3885 [Cylindrospermum stagnale PCC 7417]